MREYLLRIVTVALVVGLCDLLVPAGEREGLRRAVRLVAGLCILCILVAPFAQLNTTLSESDPRRWLEAMEAQAQASYEERMKEKLTAATAEGWRQALSEMLGERFDIREEDMTWHIEWEEESETLRARHIALGLRGRAIFCDPRKVEAAVEEVAGCTCTVSLG